MKQPVMAVPDPAVFAPIVIDEELCIGCNLCVLVCQADLFLPSTEKGGAPEVYYAGECWMEGSCVDHCPVPGAITLQTPLFNRVHWEESRAPASPLPPAPAQPATDDAAHGPR